ncbi:MAG: hypothetical protein EZS26_003190 [Candidatus Ordinivivax streblomastigis]|uniref:Uncharacterized protein n=1 Tax=Candidatus Ordinivivax streblomastigis TaxID=2540710 RepID=A0A5M8NVE6_9BACT|nr:MAG: hypothetical protein EZS26_003190 [Candidatus Ordinivivax streblomastigis]
MPDICKKAQFGLYQFFGLFLVHLCHTQFVTQFDAVEVESQSGKQEKQYYDTVAGIRPACFVKRRFFNDCHPSNFITPELVVSG